MKEQATQTDPPVILPQLDASSTRNLIVVGAAGTTFVFTLDQMEPYSDEQTDGKHSSSICTPASSNLPPCRARGDLRETHT